MNNRPNKLRIAFIIMSLVIVAAMMAALFVQFTIPSP